MRAVFQLLKRGLFTIGLLGFTNLANSEELKFGLPINCELNKDCFIQNLPDVLSNKTASDTYCQGATYGGHKGIDIRLLSLENIKDNVPVIASADGIVKAFQDGEEDKLMLTPQDKANIKGNECGNGIIITHVNGYESQVCHLKKNSITVKKGQKLKQGDILGFVGNSGFAAFPHVHLTVRKNGQWLDPISGAKPSQNCSSTKSKNTLLNKDTIKYFSANTSRLMISGITGSAVTHKELVKIGAPKKLSESDQAIVGWAWFINLRKGDQVRFTLEGPKGLITQNTTKPLDRHKADYSGYSGKRTKPDKGEYRLTTELLRNGQPIEEILFVQTLE